MSGATPIAVLLSGRGSNFLALHQAITRGELAARIVLVASNRISAPGLQKAKQLGIPNVAIPQEKFAGREQHEQQLLREIRRAEAEWICLAGYMRLLSKRFVGAYRHRILNIHPSLLPAFPGLEAQKQALQHGARISGCTVHLVDENLDSGPIVAQRAVAIADQDTPEDLAQRILVQEHQAYSAALGRLISENWAIEGRRIRFHHKASNC